MKILLIIFLLLPLTINAQLSSKQEGAIDSLKKIIATANHDTSIINAWIEWDNIIYNVDSELDFQLNQKIDSLCSKNLTKTLSKKERHTFLKSKGFALNNIGIIYKEQSDYANAISYYNKSLEVKEEIQDKNGIAKSLGNIGLIYSDQGDYAKAIEYHNKSLKISKEIENQTGIASSLNNIGMIYNGQGNYAKAIEYHTKSLKIREKNGDKIGISMSLNNIGIIYKDQGEISKSMTYFKKSLKIQEEVGYKIGITASLSNIGIIHMEQGENDKAMNYFKKSLKIQEEIGNRNGLGISLNNIGLIYQDEKNYSEALNYFNKSLLVREEIGDKGGISSSLTNIGHIYENLDKNLQAKKFGEQSLIIAKEIGNVINIKDAAELLWRVNKKLNRFNQSLEMYELFIISRDSLESENNQKALIKQEYKNAYEKQAAADSIKTVEANKVKDALLVAEKAENRQNQQQQYFLYVGLVLAILFGGIIYNRFKLANKQKGIIQEQKQVVDKAFVGLEEAHKEITDSINYAERIQNSFLATKEVLDANLNEYFVFFQPKDVVSGDFYWAGKLINGDFAMVNADSTGHGVPGSIMSILNISSIESAVKDKLTVPAAIFNDARKTIIERLKKDGSLEGGKDGMDASLISFNEDKTKMSYVAAQNPIWIIRKGELTEIKAEKMPVGKHDNDQTPFKGGEFDIQKGDQIYTLTDGFQDQFGGPRGKKYMVKKMRKLVLSIADLGMNEQHHKIKDSFTTWKGDAEQVDDVCVIGIRI